MIQKTYFSIGEFSRLTGIARPNLRFYDEIGLLQPEHRGENNYRGYARRQLNSAYLIVSLRELGIGLEDIRRYAQGRTPARMIALFDAQEARIAQELDKLLRIRATMRSYVEMTREALREEHAGVRVIQRAAEPIFSGAAIDRSVTTQEAVVAFYDLAAAKGVNRGSPLGSVIARRDFDRGQTTAVSHFYFRTRHGKNAVKPAGRYAVAYARCAPGESGAVCRQMQAFAAEHGLQLRGDAYEEYPIDELSTQDEAQFCVRLEMLIAD